jgi:hypothetical protein
MECQLYRYFDEEGCLLYVGISHSAVVRAQAHRKSAWWIDAAEMKIENFPTRELALEAERRAIKTEKPRFNKVHNDADKQIELFKSEECGKELERIPINRASRLDELSPISWECSLCGKRCLEDCSAKCFTKLKPAMWFLDLEKTGQTIRRNGTDYVQFRGVDCYGQIIAHHVPIGSRAANCGRGRWGSAVAPIFFTYRAA